MTKNENNSHAFLRKMVENIKQTKDAQCPDDAKANEVCTHTRTCLLNVANKRQQKTAAGEIKKR